MLFLHEANLPCNGCVTSYLVAKQIHYICVSFYQLTIGDEKLNDVQTVDLDGHMKGAFMVNVEFIRFTTLKSR